MAAAPVEPSGPPHDDLESYDPGVGVVRSIILFVVAALAEIGGAWLVWQGVRENRGVAWVGAGIAALAAYGFVATFQDDPNFGRVPGWSAMSGFERWPAGRIRKPRGARASFQRPRVMAKLLFFPADVNGCGGSRRRCETTDALKTLASS